MKIYINMIRHVGWDDDIDSLELYTTFPMSKHEFVEYYNEHIAGKDTEGYEDLGIHTDIHRFCCSGTWRSKIFQKLELDEDEDEDEDCYDLKFAGCDKYYSFSSTCVSLVDIKENKEVMER